MANEKRLIDANALLNLLKPLEEHSKILKKILLVIQNCPTVDAVEVVHGRWEDGCAMHNGKVVYHSIDCSVCQGVFKADSRETAEYWKERFKVCPFCGAIMDGGNEDG